MRVRVAALLGLFGAARAVRPFEQSLASSAEDLPQHEAASALERRGAAVGNFSTDTAEGTKVLRIGAHGELHAGRRSRSYRSCPNLCSDKRPLQVDKKVELRDGVKVTCGWFAEDFKAHPEYCNEGQWYAKNWDKISESCCKACDFCPEGQVLREGGSEGGSCLFIRDGLFKGGEVEACDHVEEEPLKTWRRDCCAAPEPKLVVPKPVAVDSVTQAPGCPLCQSGQTLRKEADGKEAQVCRLIQKKLFEDGKGCKALEGAWLEKTRKDCCAKLTIVVPDKDECLLCGPDGTRKADPAECSATDTLLREGQACTKLKAEERKALRAKCCVIPDVSTVVKADRCQLCEPNTRFEDGYVGKVFGKYDTCSAARTKIPEDWATCKDFEEKKGATLSIIRNTCCFREPKVVAGGDSQKPLKEVTKAPVIEEDDPEIQAKVTESVIVNEVPKIQAKRCQLCEPNAKLEDSNLGPAAIKYQTCSAQLAKVAEDWATCAEFEAAKSGLADLLRRKCCAERPAVVVGENPQKVVPKVDAPCTLCAADEDFVQDEAYGKASCIDLKDDIEKDQAVCKDRQSDTDVAVQRYFCCAKKNPRSPSTGGDFNVDIQDCAFCGPDEVLQEGKVFVGVRCGLLAGKFVEEPRLCKAIVETGQAGAFKMIRARCCAKTGSRSDLPQTLSTLPGVNVDVTNEGSSQVSSGVITDQQRSDSATVDPDAWKVSTKHRTGPAVCMREDIKKLQGWGEKAKIWKDKSGPQKMREDIAAACEKLDDLRKKAADKEKDVIKARTVKDNYMASYLSHYADLYAREKRITEAFAGLHAKEEQALKAQEALKQLKTSR